MTVNEMADLANVSPDTIRRAIKKLYPQRLIDGKKTVLLKEEAIAVVGSVRKEGYWEPPQDAAQSAEVNRLGRLDRLESIVEKLCVAVATLIPSLTTTQPIQIEAPQMTERAELNRIVRDYVELTEISYSEGWSLLYKEALYRMEINITTRARHAGKLPLDLAEELGILPQLLAIAREVLR
jgi:hypothetical protein